MKKSTMFKTIISAGIMGMTLATVVQADQYGTIINNQHAKQITNNQPVNKVNQDKDNNLINQDNASSNSGKVVSTGADISASDLTMDATTGSGFTSVVNNTTIDHASVSGSNSVGAISISSTVSPSYGGTAIGTNNSNSVTATQTATISR